MKLQIPSVEPKIITGSDNLDSWSESTWQCALINVKIVITTPQVLLDALVHGFVRISSVALLIFDEGQATLFVSDRIQLTKHQHIIVIRNTPIVVS